MPVLVLDEIKGSDLQVTPIAARYVRMGHINDIEIVGLSDADALVRCLPLLPQFFTPLGALSPNLKLTNMRVFPDDARVNRVKVQLTYETTVANFTPTIYMLRDRSYSYQEPRPEIPGTHQLITLGNGDINATVDAEDDSTITQKPQFVDFNLNVRAIQLTVLQYGRPAGGSQDYGNYVNDAPWPSAGDVSFNGTPGLTVPTIINLKTATARPRGFWRLCGYSTDYNRNAGMTLVQTESLSKNIEDWSNRIVLRSEKTGNFPFGANPGRLSIISTANAQQYEHGLIWPPTPLTTPNNVGYGRVGGYPVTSFPGIFGFIWPILLMISLVI